MSYEINPRKIVGVVNQVNQALVHQGFNHGEVLVGLAEVIGRTIVETSQTPIQGAEAAKVVADHLQRTLHAGFTSKGFNMSGSE